MAGFKVTPEELEAGKGKLTDVAGQIEQLLSRTQQEVRRLVGDAWSGAARERFEQYMTEWNTLAAKQQENLKSVAEALGVAAANYREAENAAERSFNV